MLSIHPLTLSAGDCTAEFDSTFALIQGAIFEQRGCTDSLCHGAARAGGLDLRAGVAYDNLVGATAQSAAGWERVVPGQKELSLLWYNLAAATLPDLWHAPVRPMPLGGLPPLTFEELEVVRAWIEGGAPRNDVVPETGELLDACLPPARPVAIAPLDPPAADTGVQVRMPRWELPPHSEDEICFASYYDVAAQVPAKYRGPSGNTFRFKALHLRQDPLSHHLIVAQSGASPHDPSWGPFACRGGDKNGTPCDPMNLGFCGDGVCGSRPVSSFACLGFGPGVFEIAVGGFVGTQETATLRTSAAGVYNELPLSGMMIWNSHAFNLTDFDGKMEAWLNFAFAEPEEQRFPELDIFNTDKIFDVFVPPFRAQEVCDVHVLAPRTKLTSISSHTHRRGKRWRTFLGAFRCDGGPSAGNPCSPFGPDTAHEAPDICAGAPCRATLPAAVGDCNGDLAVEIDELLTGIGIALGEVNWSRCRRFDPDGDRTVGVADLVSATNALLHPRDRDPEESLLYTSFVYNDAVNLRFDPPMVFPGSQSVAAERSLTYCSLYDNGFTDPADVRRRSTSPPNGGLCYPSHCAAGRVGAPCVGNTQAQRDASCNSTANARDGRCDACSLTGGESTEEEMLVFFGTFFIE